MSLDEEVYGKPQQRVKNVAISNVCDNSPTEVTRMFPGAFVEYVCCLKILDATNLPALDKWSGAADPYCRVFLQNPELVSTSISSVGIQKIKQVKRTSKKQKTVDPNWADENVMKFILRSDNGIQETLCIEVWDFDSGSKDELIGFAKIEIASIMAPLLARRAAIVQVDEDDKLISDKIVGNVAFMSQNPEPMTITLSGGQVDKFNSKSCIRFVLGFESYLVTLAAYSQLRLSSVSPIAAQARGFLVTRDCEGNKYVQYVLDVTLEYEIEKGNGIDTSKSSYLSSTVSDGERIMSTQGIKVKTQVARRMKEFRKLEDCVQRDFRHTLKHVKDRPEFPHGSLREYFKNGKTGTNESLVLKRQKRLNLWLQALINVPPIANSCAMKTFLFEPVLTQNWTKKLAESVFDEKNRVRHHTVDRSNSESNNSDNFDDSLSKNVMNTSESIRDVSSSSVEEGTHIQNDSDNSETCFNNGSRMLRVSQQTSTQKKSRGFQGQCNREKSGSSFEMKVIDNTTRDSTSLKSSQVPQSRNSTISPGPGYTRRKPRSTVSIPQGWLPVQSDDQIGPTENIDNRNHTIHGGSHHEESTHISNNNNNENKGKRQSIHNVRIQRGNKNKVTFKENVVVQQGEHPHSSCETFVENTLLRCMTYSKKQSIDVRPRRFALMAASSKQSATAVSASISVRQGHEFASMYSPDPNEFKAFWMMRKLGAAVAPGDGGYLTPALFLPSQVWSRVGVKLESLPLKQKAFQELSRHLGHMHSVQIGFGTKTKTQAGDSLANLKRFKVGLKHICKMLPDMQSTLSKHCPYIPEAKVNRSWIRELRHKGARVRERANLKLQRYFKDDIRVPDLGSYRRVLCDICEGIILINDIFLAFVAAEAASIGTSKRSSSRRRAVSVVRNSKALSDDMKDVVAHVSKLADFVKVVVWAIVLRDLKVLVEHDILHTRRVFAAPPPSFRNTQRQEQQEREERRERHREWEKAKKRTKEKRRISLNRKKKIIDETGSKVFRLSRLQIPEHVIKSENIDLDWH